MYVYATEMVSDYYSKLNIRNKRVLSITGSGDQIINAYFFGAKEVIGFDINKYASFFLEFKVSAISNLTYQEFIRFFGKDMVNGTLDIKLYNKLKQNLSSSARNFFDKIYKEFKNNGRRLLKSGYFRQRAMILSSAARINIYLKNEKNYLKCRDIMSNKKLQSLELDINDILASKKLKGKFDIINLSNVLNYLTSNTEEDNLLKVLAAVTKKVSQRVKTGGVFFGYSYFYGLYSSTGKKIPPAFSLGTIHQIAKINNFPAASRLGMIRQIAKINNFQVAFKKFKGVNPHTLNRINIFTV